MHASSDKISTILKKHKGVLKVEVPEKDFISLLADDDMSVDTSFGMPIENRAMRDCLSTDLVLCLYADLAFEKPNDRTMMITDAKGNIVGHDIPRSQIDEYRIRTDLVWLSDDFVLYPNIGMTDEMTFVMLSQEYHGFSEEDGVFKAIMYYPAPSTHCLIKQRYGDPMDPMVATVLMGISFNY
ncbi:MAG TPA: hypothetical protein VJX93_03150 [Candidatus Methanomethylophilaceae archaeon]|nr:hypothetical protein [Candidatus Methanomethylophilaceae archaeon]